MASLLAARRDEILGRWLEANTAQPFHGTRPEGAVAGHIPSLLDGLIAFLRRHAAAGDGGAQPEDPAILRHARAHAAARFAQGLRPSEIATEFRLLRQEIGHGLRLDPPQGMPAEDLAGAELLVQDAVDAAVSVALTAFDQQEAERRELAAQVGAQAAEQDRTLVLLRESEHRYRNIFETAAVSIWEEDFSAVKHLIDGLRARGVGDLATYLGAHPEVVAEAAGLVRIVDVNQHSLHMFGAASKEDLIASLERTLLPETLPVFRDELIAIAEGRRHLAVETPLRTLRGERLDVLVTITFPEPGASFERVLVSLMDITARRQAEAERGRALAAAEAERARMRAMLMQAPALIALLHGPGHVYELANPPYLQLIGRRNADEVVGRRVRDVVPEVEVQGYLDLLDRVYASGQPFISNELPVQLDRRDDGTLDDVFLNIVLQPYRDAAGEVEGILVHATEVTELVRAREAVRESEERFRTLADNISQFAWMADPAGRIFWYNRRWFDYTGTTLEEMQGWGWTRVHHPDHVDRVVARIRRSWETGEPWEDVFPLRGADGGYRWFLSRALPIHDAGGAIVRWFGTNTDITELREAEAARERLLASEREARTEAEQQRFAAEGAHQSLQTFLGVVAHDMRSPLTTILGHVQLLRRRSVPAAPEHLGSALESVEGSVRRMNEMIGDLLDAARVGAGQFEVRPEPMDLVALTRRVVEAKQVTTERHRISLDAPARLEGAWDPGRLAQVLENLLGNAVKYSPEGGEVIVRVRREDSQAVVSVTDPGIGMRREDQSRLFQLFSRLEPGRGIEGTGLGLYITRGIVEAHGGRIWAESPGPGQGSTFAFTLLATPPGPAT